MWLLTAVGEILAGSVPAVVPGSGRNLIQVSQVSMAAA